jgi:hypothetical protein
LLFVTYIETWIGTAIIAYLHDRVNFCFLEPEEKGQSLIKDLRVESQIGDARRHGKYTYNLHLFI